jgi:HD-GYP domain-containing protein (c-di-GMP phosphodiesterase class II)
MTYHMMMLVRYTIVDELEKKAAELTDALELLVQSYDDTLQVLGSTLELKDAETEAHCQRVTAYTISIAKSIPVPLPYLTVLARAAFLHDIGKSGVTLLLAVRHVTLLGLVQTTVRTLIWYGASHFALS